MFNDSTEAKGFLKKHTHTYDKYIDKLAGDFCCHIANKIKSLSCCGNCKNYYINTTDDGEIHLCELDKPNPFHSDKCEDWVHDP